LSSFASLGQTSGCEILSLLKIALASFLWTSSFVGVIVGLACGVLNVLPNFVGLLLCLASVVRSLVLKITGLLVGIVSDLAASILNVLSNF